MVIGERKLKSIYACSYHFWCVEYTRQWKTTTNQDHIYSLFWYLGKMNTHCQIQTFAFWSGISTRGSPQDLKMGILKKIPFSTPANSYFRNMGIFGRGVSPMRTEIVGFWETGHTLSFDSLSVDIPYYQRLWEKLIMRKDEVLWPITVLGSSISLRSTHFAKANQSH